MSLSNISAVNCSLNRLNLRLLSFYSFFHCKSADCKKNYQDQPTQISAVYSILSVLCTKYISFSSQLEAHQARNQGCAGGQAPKKMYWTSIKIIGHSSKILGPSQKTLRPSW